MKNKSGNGNGRVQTILWVVFAFTMLGFLLDMAYAFRTNGTPDWSGLGTVSAYLTIALSFVSVNSKDVSKGKKHE